MRRGFSNRRTSGRPLRGMEWLGGSATTTQTVAQGISTGFVVASAADLDSYTEPTIMRLRGNIFVSQTSGTDTSETDGSVTGVAMGIIQVPDELALTAIDAINDIRKDWLWWWFTVVGTNRGLTRLGTSAGVAADFGAFLDTSPPHVFDRIVVDSKARRKIKTGEKLVMYVQTTSIDGDEAVAFNFAIRVLIKE